MISYDYKKFEKMAQFVEFLEVMSNPEALKAVVVELDEKLKELREGLGVLRALEDVRKFESEITAKLKADADAVEQAAKQQKAMVDSDEKRLKARQAELAEAEAKVQALLAQQAQDEKLLKSREFEVGKRELAAAKSWEAVQTAAVDLKTREDAFKQKVEKFQALVS